MIFGEEFKIFFVTVLALSFFYIILSSPAALATNIVIDKQTGPAESDLFHTTNYANDAPAFRRHWINQKVGIQLLSMKGTTILQK